LRGGESSLRSAVAGHHGRPPPREDNYAAAKNALRESEWLDPPCLVAAQFAFDALKRLTGARPAAGLDADNTPLFSWRLAGLITLADWVGSDANFFGPASIETPLEDYWREARSAAGRALCAKGLTPLSGAPSATLERIAPRAAASPRPMQRLAGELSLGPGPQLFLIEDATGSGKSEAALLLAARLMAGGLGEGLYFALPTMATANAMHGRLSGIAPQLFADDPNARLPSVILSHGKAQVAAALARLGGDPQR